MSGYPALVSKFQRPSLQMFRIFLAGLFASVALQSYAQEWTATQIEEQLGAPALEIKDGKRVVSAALEDAVEHVWLEQPTEIYPHGVFGEPQEYDRLHAKLRDGTSLSTYALFNTVFEERLPRLADLDLDGTSEIVVSMSDFDLGASVAVFGIRDGALKLLAQTPYIGLANRWRNVAGIADFDGDGNLQIAEVVTPHIGGTLRFWTWKSGSLVPTAQEFGFSNHAYGSPEQRLSAIEDFDGDGVEDLAVPGADRRSVKLMKFSGPANGEKTLELLAEIPLPAEIDRPLVSQHSNGEVSVRVGLRNGTVWKIHKQQSQ